MAETIRAFIAVELNDQIKETIRGFQEHLKPLGCDISWVKPENAHLTLKFLGDVKMKMIPSVTETLANSCRDLRFFDTTLRSEEHTSELQSQFHLVCRLLLEK